MGKDSTESRQSDQDNDTISKLLWTESGIKTAIKIWKQFTGWRYEREQRNEDEEEEARDRDRGWGGLRSSP